MTRLLSLALLLSVLSGTVHAEFRADHFSVIRELLSLGMFNVYNKPHRESDFAACTSVAVEQRKDCERRSAIVADTIEKAAREVDEAENAALVKKDEGEAARLLLLAARDISWHHQLRDQWVQTYFPQQAEVREERL